MARKERLCVTVESESLHDHTEHTADIQLGHKWVIATWSRKYEGKTLSTFEVVKVDEEITVKTPLGKLVLEYP